MLRTPARWLPAFVAVLACAPATAAAPPEFARDVIPVLTKAGCNAGACHGAFSGRGLLPLSLLGYDPAADHDALFKAARGRRGLPSAPEASLLLRKATGAMAHGGGKRLDPASPGYAVVRDYLAAGAPAPSAADARVLRLSVTPSSLVLSPGRSASLTVTAEWSDGVRRDVTALALFDSRDGRVATVTPAGSVGAIRPGKSPVGVRFLGLVASADVTVPFAAVAAADGFVPHNALDELALDEWKRVGLTPSGLCGDSEFIRRATLDLTGTLPTPDETRKFLADADPKKRDKLVDALLERPEYVDYWTLFWSDLLRAHRRFLGEKGLASFRGWLTRAVRENRPIDRMARELLTAQGDLATTGPVAVYFIDSKPEEMAETVAQVFLGVRIHCAKCHHHPFELWAQDDYHGLAAFFTRLEVKDAGMQGAKFGGPKSLRPTAAPTAARQQQKPRPPRMFGHDVPADAPDVRVPLAEWVTRRDNPYFARSFANRFWAQLTGRGLVEPVDDLRATNPASIPAVLDRLAKEFTDSGFDAKHLLRMMAKSRLYQLSSRPAGPHDRDGALFTHRLPRRLPAEVMLDAVNAAAGVTEAFEGQPPGTRAVQLPDPAVPSYFLMTFGRPVRNSACACSRGGTPDLAQALHLSNGTAIHEKVTSPAGRVAKLLARKAGDSEIAEELYLAALSRLPTDAERATVRELVMVSPSREQGWQDVLWALLNSAEFGFNH
jgi:hypothetical protein